MIFLYCGNMVVSTGFKKGQASSCSFTSFNKISSGDGLSIDEESVFSIEGTESEAGDLSCPFFPFFLESRELVSSFCTGESYSLRLALVGLS